MPVRGRSYDDLNGPIPRDVYERLSREAIGYIDAWRDRTIAAEAEVERLREALTDFRAAIDAQRNRRIDENEHDHRLANAVLDDVVAEYNLRFTDEADAS